jgi:hypothetical protein
VKIKPKYQQNSIAKKLIANQLRSIRDIPLITYHLIVLLSIYHATLKNNTIAYKTQLITKNLLSKFLVKIML